jgi:endonuclease YncB( thermonuclease family)
MNTAAGKQAKVFAIAWFQQHCPDGRFILATQLDHTEKYGRFLGDIYARDGAHLNADLVAAGQAVTYFPKVAQPDMGGVHVTGEGDDDGEAGSGD